MSLERQPKAELDLTGRAQRVDAGSDTNTIKIVTTVCSSVDLPHSTREESIHHIPGQIKVREIE